MIQDENMLKVWGKVLKIREVFLEYLSPFLNLFEKFRFTHLADNFQSALLVEGCPCTFSSSIEVFRRIVATTDVQQKTQQ